MLSPYFEYNSLSVPTTLLKEDLGAPKQLNNDELGTLSFFLTKQDFKL